jgi:hypothetical protein
MFHAQAYRRILVVATGAGIGPVLLYLSTRSPSRACAGLGVPWYGPTFDS